MNPFGLAVSKLFCFRFDVDTHRCVREGVPALVELASRVDVPFTFFVNMGRAVSRRTFLSGLIPRPTSRDLPQAEKFSASAKLGWVGYLHAAALNPAVGAGALAVLRAAHEAGHEIGLHGGRNHALWQAEAADWDAVRVADEVDAVLVTLSGVLDDQPPKGFASPGWTTNDALGGLLAERGFQYLADAHGPEPEMPKPGVPASEARPGAPALARVRTHLTGEPGGVAYLEHLRARGLDDDAIALRFEHDLDQVGPAVVAYDHPYYAGLRELPMIERMVGIVRRAGYDVVPLHTIAEAGTA